MMSETELRAELEQSETVTLTIQNLGTATFEVHFVNPADLYDEYGGVFAQIRFISGEGGFDEGQRVNLKLTEDGLKASVGSHHTLPAELETESEPTLMTDGGVDVSEDSEDSEDGEPAFITERRERFNEFAEASEGDVLTFHTNGADLELTVRSVEPTACEKYLHCEDIRGVPFTVELDPRHNSVMVSVGYTDADVQKYD